MKKSILSVALIAFMAGTISVSYGVNRDQNALPGSEYTHQVNRDYSKQDFRDQQRKSTFEFQSFKKESQSRIRENEKRISNFKVKVSRLQSRDRALYRKDLRVLEQKNDLLKRRLSNFRVKQQDRMDTFKNQFNRDLNKVSEELRDFKFDVRREQR